MAANSNSWAKRARWPASTRPDVGFFLKKLVGELLMPLPMVFAGALVGLALLRWSDRRRLARVLLVGSAVVLWAASCEPLVSPWVARLERVHPAFPGDSVDVVVVLGGGHVSDASVPPGARLSGQALYRITEGVRIGTAQPWTELILSGYGGADPVPSAEAYRDVAVSLGMPESRLILEPRPRDTAEEARLLAPLLRGRRFALVTSATHMPRAVALFRGQGLEPVPAPTGHLVRRGRSWNWRLLPPRVGALAEAQQLWYEVLGSVWVRLRGQT